MFHLDDSHKEPLFILLMHRSTDGTNGPAQHVQVSPRPLGAIHLVVKLLCHDAFSISIVQMSQIHCAQRESYLIQSANITSKCC